MKGQDAVTRKRGRHVLVVSLVVELSGCAMQSYVAAPPDESLVPTEMQSAALDIPTQQALLARLGATGERLDGRWSARQLGVLAVDRSRAVAAARSEIQATLGRAKLARQRQNPQVNMALERHTEEEDGSSSLWSVGPSIDLTLVPPAVRRLTGERAGLEVAIARLDAIEIAWQAHDSAVEAALTVFDRHEEGAYLQRASAMRDAAVAAARALVAAGIADPFEWQTMMLERNDARLARLARTSASAAAQADLASALGMPVAAVAELAVVADPVPPMPDYVELQRDMLKEHPALLRALAVHAQAERDLALAIAAQYPSVQLSPGYFFDQGDHVLSLLGGIVVPLFASHDVAIASAASARDAAAARVQATQAALIADLQRAHARWDTARSVLVEARAIVGEVRAAHAELRRKRDEDIGDDLAVARAALQVEEAGLQLAAARAEERHARAGVVAAARLAALDPLFARWLAVLSEERPAEETSFR